VPQFLARNVYGDKEAELDERLALRYLDHGLSRRECHKTGDISYILPSPFGKGGTWYFQAFEAIKMDVHPAGNWSLWMEFWMEFDVFSRLGYMEKLRMLQWFEISQTRRMIDKKWDGILWFLLPLVLLSGWLTRLLRWSVMRTVGRPDRMPWPLPLVGQRFPKNDEQGEGIV